MFRNVLTLVLCVVIPVTTGVAAENHIVPSAELHRQLVSASQVRLTNLAKADKFFSLAPVESALRTVKIDGAQVKSAVGLLSDDELARLTLRTDAVQADLAGGALNNQELTYIIIALATAVLILVIVAAR